MPIQSPFSALSGIAPEDADNFVMQEPAPYRPAEQVVREWIAYYQYHHAGRVPGVIWLSDKTRLGRSCVYHARKEALKAMQNAKQSTARTVKQ